MVIAWLRGGELTRINVLRRSKERSKRTLLEIKTKVSVLLLLTQIVDVIFIVQCELDHSVDLCWLGNF